MKMSEHSPESDLHQMELPLMSSAEGSPASRSARPVTEDAQPLTYGPSMPAWQAKSDHHSPSLRTSKSNPSDAPPDILKGLGCEQSSSVLERMIAAIRCAENGASEAEMNAMFGWSDRSRESAVYIRKASREKLGVAASERMIPAEVVKIRKDNADE